MSEIMYINLEPVWSVCPIFCGLTPLKQGPFQTKQGAFGFQVILELGWPPTSDTRLVKGIKQAIYD